MLTARCSTPWGGTRPPGTDAMAHQWPQGLLYAFPPIQTSAQPAAENRPGGGPCDPGSTRLGPHDMVLVGDTTPGRDNAETSSLVQWYSAQLGLFIDGAGEATIGMVCVK